MGQCLKKSHSEPKKTEVNDWLAENGLGEYSAKFKERGWDEVSLLLEMSDIQIESCIQKPGHVVKFKRALGRLDPNVDDLTDMDFSYNTESRPKTNRQNSNFHRTGSGHSAQRNRRRASHSSQSDSEPIPQNVNLTRMGSGTGNRRRVSYSSDSDSGFKPTPAKQNAKPIKTMDAQVHHQGHGSNSSGSGSIENEHVTVTRVKKLGIPVGETKSISSADDDSHDDEKNLEPTDRGVTYQVEGTANVKLQRTREDTSSVSSEEMHQLSNRQNYVQAQNSLSGQMEMIAKWYQKKDQLYVETHAFHELKSIIDEIHWATLLGKPGDGKSAMAAHLMLKYLEKGYAPMFISTAEEWKTLVLDCKNTKQFVVIDDIFGTSIVDKSKVDEWLAVIGNILPLIKERHGDLQVVCTSRRYIFKDVQAELDKFKFFENYYIVDMTDDTYQLTPDEKMDIFNNFAVEQYVPESEKVDVRNVDSPHGFPHSVELFCTSTKFRQTKGISFFENPVQCVREEIYDFKDSDQIKYVILLLVLLNNNHMEEDFFDRLQNNASEDEMRIFQDAGVSLQIHHFTVSFAVDYLEHSYLTHGPDGTYCFSHDLLMEIVASIYITVNPPHAIEVLDFSFILAFINDGSVNTGQMKDTHRAVISCLPKGSAQALAKRITRELKKGNMTAVGYCAAWRDQSFVREWIKYVTTSVDNKTELAKMLATQSEVTTL